MKIGIVTFWDSQDNYGQLLQCYALQAYLIKTGHEPFLIRFLPSAKRKNMLSLILRIGKIFSPTYFLTYLKVHKLRKKSNSFNRLHPRNFDQFRKNYIISSSRTYSSFSELWCENWDADAFICGSDQIWSYSLLKDNIRAYFLDFVPLNSKIISYAASFGRSELPADYKEILPTLLNKFTAIGLRENSGVRLCCQAGRNDSTLVCDPTLLLTGDDYLKSIIVNDVCIDNSAFCYLLNWETEFPQNELDSFISSKNWTMNYFPAHGIENKNIFSPIHDLSIASWIQSMASSQCVFTNSFHGTVFSILLKRPFVSFPLKGNSSGMNDRLFTLLTMLGLENRVYSIDKPLEDIVNFPIDWDIVYQRLNQFRDKSMQFLENALDSNFDEEIKSRKIKTICFQTFGGINHDYGGLDRVTELLADYFEEQGYVVYYLSLNPRPGINDRRQYYLPDKKNIFTTENINYYNHFLDSKNIDVLINQEGNVNICLPRKENSRSVIFLTALHFNPAYIMTDHFDRKFMNMPIPNQLKNLLTCFFRIPYIKKQAINYLNTKLSENYQYQCSHCNCFVMLSNRFREDLAYFFRKTELPANVCAINNPSTFGQIQVNFSNKSKKLLYVGRLECGMKRVDRLLSYWKQISVDFPDWSFHLVGTGPDEKKLKDMASQMSLQRIYFEGTQNPRPYYEEASVFCFSSASEGWGMVLVEAQSAGCVPIAFNSYSAISDIITDGENGCLIAPFDENLYMDTLMKLMKNDKFRYKMAKNSVQKVSQFHIGKIGRQWIDLFYKIGEQGFY